MWPLMTLKVCWSDIKQENHNSNGFYIKILRTRLISPSYRVKGDVQREFTFVIISDWISFILVYQKSLKRTFNLGFEHKITLWICVLMLWIHKGIVVKKLVYVIFFVLKLSGIERLLCSHKANVKCSN